MTRHLNLNLIFTNGMIVFVTLISPLKENSISQLPLFVIFNTLP